MEETNLQAFIAALYEAHSASKAVDYFDLREDEAAAREWDRLLKQQQDAFRALHKVSCRVSVEDLMG